jgi:hypothetical protein
MKAFESAVARRDLARVRAILESLYFDGPAIALILKMCGSTARRMIPRWRSNSAGDRNEGQWKVDSGSGPG